jgi:hypothetical protein
MKNQGLFILMLAASALISPSGFCQDTRLPSSQAKYMHHEKPDDPYMPNAGGNKLTSPPYRFSNSLKSISSRSTIFTTQVNIDAQGQNILGDAANEPSIAVNPADRNLMSIGWRQFDNISSNFRQAGWAFTTNGGESWTFPGVIEPGIFRSDPVLDYDADGNFYYNSLTNDPDYFCKVFKSNNGGEAWDAGTDAGGGDKQWMAIDRTTGVGRGNIYSSWTSYFSTCLPGFFTRSTNNGESYEECTVVDGYPFWATMTVGNSGELFIGGRADFMDSLVVAKSLTAREPDASVTWNKPVAVYFDGVPSGWKGVNPGGLLGQVNIDVDRSNGVGRGNVYLLSTVTRTSSIDPADVMFSRSLDGGLTWSYPVKINDDNSTTNYQWFGTMSVAPNGRIDAIWLDTRDAPPGSDSSALYYSFSSDQGMTWSQNERLSESFDSHVGYPNQNKLGDYFDMQSENEGAHLAWAGTFNGEQDVFYSFIVPYASTGINKIVYNSQIRAYPNPVIGTLSISNFAENSLIELYTFQGQKLYSDRCRETTCEIDLSARPAGIYLLKVIDQNGRTEVRKIVKD